MQNATRSAERSRGGLLHGTLAGAKAWIISDGKAGHEALCLGVAQALGLTAELKHIAPRGLWKAMAPWGPVSPAELFGRPGTPFAPPWPPIAFAAGRTTTPYIRALKRRAGLKTFTVVMLDPKTGRGSADLFWVPEHDARRGPNVVTTLTAPHAYSAERLANLRAHPDPLLAHLDTPRVAVLVGGPNDRYLYPEPVIRRFSALVQSLASLGAGLMMTVSRRTPPPLVEALKGIADGTGAVLWTGEGPNPYPSFLAEADAFLVTADSVNMAGEAAATGRPIYVFEPDGGAAKFTAFHSALRERGVTREAPESFTSLDAWSYAPLNAADTIAHEIEQRWQRRKSLLTGLT